MGGFRPPFGLPLPAYLALRFVPMSFVQRQVLLPVPGSGTYCQTGWTRGEGFTSDGGTAGRITECFRTSGSARAMVRASARGRWIRPDRWRWSGSGRGPCMALPDYFSG